MRSWDEIALFLGVDKKTAQDWDRKNSMPIIRLGRGTIITSRAMMQTWINSPKGTFDAYAMVK